MITLAEWIPTRYQKKLVKEVFKSRRLTYGDMTREFERQFAEIHGARYAIFTSSGTIGLYIAIRALKEKYGWKDGDEVIIPAVTFVATMNVVLMNNLKPVLVDVNQYGNIDVSLIEKAITKKTKAVIPVHLLGLPADMESVTKIAKKYKLKVIEDSCETMFVNKLEGDVICFSTYAAHLLVTGVGGFILTNDKKLATVMRSMSFHGRDESYLNMDDKSTIHKKFFFPRFGLSGRITELEAAIGLGGLVDREEMVKKRQANAKYLQEHIGRKALGLWSPVTPEDYDKHAFMFYPITVTDRDKLAIHLEKAGIDSRLMMPLTNQPVAKPYLKKSYPMADHFNECGLLIPCHQYLTKKDLDYMIEVICEFYQ